MNKTLSLQAAWAFFVLLWVAPALAANSAEATAAAKRHFADRSAAGTARPASSTSARSGRPAPAAPDNWAAQLASCKAQAGMNPIKREKCVWSHCNHHWGDGDCPPGSDWPPKFEKPKFEKFGSTPAKTH